jgi:release factor glutamine methyltransferase
MNVKMLLQIGAENLSKTHIKNAISETYILLSFSINKTKEFLLAHPDYSVNKQDEKKFLKSIKKRVSEMPIAYIIGHKEFYGFDFEVNKHTLIPRPETEMLVEETLKLSHGNTNIIDIGTGSGNIIISIAKQLKSQEVKDEKQKFFGIDTSQKTLAVAQRNAKIHNVYDKIKFLRGNLLKPILKLFTANYSLKTASCIIVANLPYLSQKIYSAMNRSVKDFEPKKALLSGEYGLDHYCELFGQTATMEMKYQQKITILLEISPEQKTNIEKEIPKRFVHAKISFRKDLSQKWRLVCIQI